MSASTNGLPAKAARVAGFLVLTACLFVAALWGSSKLRFGDYTLLQTMTGNELTPGGPYQSLRRFREAAERGPVDIVFFGSSHAYRGFDPRIFDAAGYSAQNLGSTNQTPLNTLYLAERYLPALRPRLVVIEVYYQTLSSDGLEACRDLAVNTPASWPMTKMAVATWNLGAMSFAMASDLGLTAGPAGARQQEVEGETYVEGGYAETKGHRKELLEVDPFSIAILPEQLGYLKRVSALARSMGARVVWVTHPLPEDHRSRIRNRADLRKQIAGAAEESGVPYWDFDERMRLDPLASYLDFHHLSAAGVEAFDHALLEELRASGYLR
jgi:hypothetical protein